MKRIVSFILIISFFNCFSQKRDISIVASSLSEAEVTVKIINNTSEKKLLFLDSKNLGVEYNNKTSFVNSNSSKIYVDFLDLNEDEAIVPVSNLNNYSSGKMKEEDFASEIKNNTISFLPHEEKTVIINLYRQKESAYLNTYTILPAKTYKVCLKIYGQRVEEGLKKSALSDSRLKSILSAYDFNDYISNEFELKIKTVKSPLPLPLAPGKDVKYTEEELR